MRSIILFFLLFFRVILAVDYDYVFVGSSPIVLLEALYQANCRSRVLLIEASSSLGGAWKAINICGVRNVDMGCHQIGTGSRDFLETYIGCHMVPMQSPCSTPLQSNDNGLYFSQGCFELIDHLRSLLLASGVRLIEGTALESVRLDFERSTIYGKAGKEHFTASKLMITPHTKLFVENFPTIHNDSISKYPHLYILIEDPTPPRFTYVNGFCSGVSRAINVSPFSQDLMGSGHQLIAIQTWSACTSMQVNDFVESLKTKNMIDRSARLITWEHYTYEQSNFSLGALIGQNPKVKDFIQVLDTGAFWNIAQHVPRWQKVMKPYHQIIGG